MYVFLRLCGLTKPPYEKGLFKVRSVHVKFKVLVRPLVRPLVKTDLGQGLVVRPYKGP
jgi:hypothetical protein